MTCTKFTLVSQLIYKLKAFLLPLKLQSVKKTADENKKDHQNENKIVSVTKKLSEISVNEVNVNKRLKQLGERIR